MRYSNKIYISLLFVSISLSAFSQTETYNSHVGLGFHLGYNISNMKFVSADKENAPDYKAIKGYSGGFIVNLMAQKIVGIQIEANFSKRGWEELEDSVYSYKRNIRYIEIPVLTHLTFGEKRFRYIFNLGPYMAFHRKTTEDFEIFKKSIVIDEGNSIGSLGKPIDNKLDLGFMFDAGFGVHTSGGVFLIKARYSQSVLNVFDKYPESIYRYSQMRNVYFGVSYFYNIYFNKR